MQYFKPTLATTQAPFESRTEIDIFVCLLWFPIDFTIDFWVLGITFMVWLQHVVSFYEIEFSDLKI